MSPIMYGLIVTLFGITIVFLVLAGLWGILAMMKVFFGGKKKQDTIESNISTTSAEATATNSPAEEMDAEELLAVITAAISACMGGQSNLLVRKITRVGDNTPIWGQISRHEQTLNRL
ncbi:MAG: sodium pump decarboxylase subunit gamma [Clostridia bacterium]|nr:sodium pump decarboxylase subunit gamma [Clostridia bacterium]